MSEHSFIERTNRYSVLQRVGAGGMGIVYKVLDQQRNMIVALKTMLRIDASSLYRFKREFRALAEVKHPNLAKLYELNAVDDHWFFTMEYIEGDTFLEYVCGQSAQPSCITETIIENGEDDQTSVSFGDSSRMAASAVTSLPQIDRLRSALLQLCCAVQAIHEAGHLHRDIKPSNIRVTNSGRLVLLDFGLITASNQAGHLHTTGDLVIGTPAYMSPEQASGETLSSASDWYSVGAILYEALTGRFPFQKVAGEPMPFMELFERKRCESLPSPASVAPNVPDDLDRLCQSLLRRDPADRVSGPELIHLLESESAGGRQSASVPAIGETLSSGLFVGRRSQLASLQEALREVRPNRPGVVHVHGISGIGKSMLVRQFLDDPAVVRQAVVLEGRCYEQESVPYKALDSVVDALSHYLAGIRPKALAPLLPENIVELARVFPVLERLEAIANAPFSAHLQTDPHSRRNRAFQAFRELLRRIADQRLIIVSIDDLQWGDLDSAAIIDELFRPPDAPAILFIGCYRSEDSTSSSFLRKHVESMRALGDYVAYRNLPVGPLGDDEAQELANALLGKRAASSQNSVALTVAMESKGHPYFLRELSRHVQGFANNLPSRRSTPNVTLTDVLSQRIAHLDENARRLLEIVAVAGHPIDQAVAIQAAGLGNDSYSALEILHAELLVRNRSVGEQVSIESFHDRIRETTIGQLSSERLRFHHRSVAQALEAHGQADPEALALHFEAAGESAKAAAYSAAAGDAASELLAFDWAAELYRRSRTLVPAGSEEYRVLTRKAADAFSHAGRGAIAAREYLAAAETADRDQAFELKRCAAHQFLGSGHIDEGLDVIRPILRTIGMGYPSTPRRALIALVFRRLAIRLRGYRFVRRPESEIDKASLSRLDTCRTIAEGLAMVDNIRGAHFQARSLLMALRAGEPVRVSLALSQEAGYTATTGMPGRRRAEQLASEAMAIAKETGHPHALGRAAFANGLRKYLIGEWRQAYEGCAEAVEILRDRCVGVTWDLTSTQRFQIGALHYMGDLREIAVRVPVLLEDARRRGDLYLSTDLLSRDYHLNWLALDQPDAARRSIEGAMNLWSRNEFHLQHYNSMLALTQCDFYANDVDAAWERLRRFWPDLQRSLLMRVQVLRAEVNFLRARAALRQVVRNPREPRLMRMLLADTRRVEKEGARWTRPLSLALRAAIACHSDRQDEGASLLRRAIADFEAVDMGLHASAASYQLGRMIGGTEGQRRLKESQEWMQSQGVKNPMSMATAFIPIPGLTGTASA